MRRERKGREVERNEMKENCIEGKEWEEGRKGTERGRGEGE